MKVVVYSVSLKELKKIASLSGLSPWQVQVYEIWGRKESFGKGLGGE